ncbi:BlaI/MecI/CopY family transcriptional regulator [Streptacidiphilus cavernicola]|uniref:BlaI/MecI/CopY family transcriptional regulator n=1 Tax=Streptacidiphilus cavernicola TaxID=3342716 RepID=A0ABV6VVK7_9ACTN
MSQEREGRGGASRRAAGELESDVMAVLWAADSALTAAQVGERLPGELAYTTVLTILSRLVDKKQLTRARSGRGYAFAPVRDQASDTARRMASLLDQGLDRKAVLTRFVSTLSGEDEALMQELLRGDEGP